MDILNDSRSCRALSDRNEEQLNFASVI